MTTDGTTTDGSEADVAEQHADLVPTEDVLAGGGATAVEEVTTEPTEADPVDVADQHRSVPYDKDER